MPAISHMSKIVSAIVLISVDMVKVGGGSGKDNGGTSERNGKP